MLRCVEMWPLALWDCDCVISVCGSVSKCVILEGFESVIRCVSTCVIPKCVMQMV